MTKTPHRNKISGFIFLILISSFHNTLFFQKMGTSYREKCLFIRDKMQGLGLV